MRPGRRRRSVWRPWERRADLLCPSPLLCNTNDSPALLVSAGKITFRDEGAELGLDSLRSHGQAAVRCYLASSGGFHGCASCPLEEAQVQDAMHCSGTAPANLNPACPGPCNTKTAVITVTNFASQCSQVSAKSSNISIAVELKVASSTQLASPKP